MTAHHSTLSEQEYFVAPTEGPTDLKIKTKVEEIEVNIDKL